MPDFEAGEEDAEFHSSINSHRFRHDGEMLKSFADWHHIVEQSSPGAVTGAYHPWEINNNANNVSIRRGIHQKCVTALMSTTMKNLTAREVKFLKIVRTEVDINKRLRQALVNYPFANAHVLGLRVLNFCGVKVA